MKTAVIGCGVIGAVHAERYDRSPRAELGWVVDLVRGKAETLATKHKVQNVATDYREMLRDPAVAAVSTCSARSRLP